MCSIKHQFSQMKLERENIPSKTHGSLHFLEIEQDYFDDHYHYHPEVELTWVCEGQGTRIIGDSIGEFKVDDLVLIGAGLPHRYHSHQPGSAAKVLRFDLQLLQKSLFQLPELGALQQLLQEAGRGLRFKKPSAQVFVLLRQLFSSSSSVAQILLFIELLAALVSDSNIITLASIGYKNNLKSSQVDLLKHILTSIQKQVDHDISLEQVAKEVHLHPQSLSRFLKKNIGLNYQQFITQIRLNKAARLLLQSDKKIIDIAFEAGYSNLSNFNRLFKKQYNRSPRDYRSRHYHA